MKKRISIIILIILTLIITIALINNTEKDENGLIYSIAIDEHFKDKENIIIKSHEELKEYFKEGYLKNASSRVEEIIEAYNSEFFENNNLAIIYEKTGNISTMFKYIKCNVKGTNAKITYQIISPKGGSPDVFVPRDIFIVVKIPKEVTSISENLIYKYK